MSDRRIFDSQLQLREQLLQDLSELSTEVSAIRDIIRMKQMLLRQTNKEIYRRTRASSYLKLIHGECCQMGSKQAEANANSYRANLRCIEGGLGRETY